MIGAQITVAAGGADVRQAGKYLFIGDANLHARQLRADAEMLANAERQAQAAQNAAQLLQLLQLLEQNTRLTEMTKTLTERIENLTSQVHQHVLGTPPPQA